MLVCIIEKAQKGGISLIKIIVNKKALSDKISELKDDSLIELAIIPAQVDCDIYFPAFLHLASIDSQANYVDLEYIDAFAL
jgi:hypothetical protein